MPNPIKYSTGSETLALKKGNFYIGTGDVGKGPTESTGYWNGISPPTSGYTIYLSKETQGPSAYVAPTDNDLITITNQISGQNYTGVTQCLTYFASQTDKMVLNSDYPSIVTDGLVLNLDAGFVPSYPRSGTTWSDISLSGNSGTLVNGPTYSSDDGGSIVFDGSNDYVNFGNILNFERTSSFTISLWFRVTSLNTYEPLISKMQSGLRGYLVSLESNGQIVLILRSELNTNQLFVRSQSSEISVNVWSNITITYNGSSQPSGVSMYKNGSDVTTSIVSNTLTGTILNSANFEVGSRTIIGDYFVGNITLLTIYNRVLSSDEILGNYNATKSRFGL